MCAYDNNEDVSMGGMAVNGGNLFDSTLAYAIKDWGSMTTQQNIDAKGSMIAELSIASNQEGDKSQTTVALSNGHLSTSEKADAAIAVPTQVITTENINAATGDLILVNSHAENTRHAYEGHWDHSTGQWTWVPDNLNVNYGGGDFQLVRSGSLTANVVSEADSDLVNIDVTGLPAGTKTAIMLEPFARFAVDQGATDMGTTVFQPLVNKGYATTRYTDSAVSESKFSELGKYNVVLVKSHMNSKSIALSTGDQMSDDVTGDELVYTKTTSPTLVILAGCDSFVPESSNYLISSKVQEADLSAFYGSTVNSVWNQDYIGKIFQDMGNGMTFKNAESDVWTNYMPVWCSQNGIDPNNWSQLSQNNIIRFSMYSPYGTDFKL